MKDTPEKLSGVSVALHWLVGGAVIALLAVGWYMAAYEVYFLYPIHKSVGMLIVAAVVARIWWRAVNGFPQFLPGVPKWRRTIARGVHWILLIGSILMPLSGIAMSVGGGRGFGYFRLGIIGGEY